MSEQKTYTLPKKERLCSKRLIDQLFLGHSHNKKEWPIRAVYQVGKRQGLDDPQVEMMVSVSKRYFKRAVKRNLVKRQLREGYRLHKAILMDALAVQPDAKLTIAFIWLSDRICPTEQVEMAMSKLLAKVLKSLDTSEIPVLEA